MKKQVVIFGNLQTGIQTVHGPFDDEEHAYQWASIHAGNQPYIVVPLERT